MVHVFPLPSLSGPYEEHSASDAGAEDIVALNDPEQTAVHEAAHAVLARRFRLVCGEVTIEPDFAEGTAGYAMIDTQYATLEAWWAAGRGCYANAERNIAYRRIMALMAGGEAERILLGKEPQGDMYDRNEIDSMLEQYAGALAEAEFRALVRHLRETTQRAIQKHRTAIERVAAALRSRKVLSGNEVDELIAI